MPDPDSHLMARMPSPTPTVSPSNPYSSCEGLLETQHRGHLLLPLRSIEPIATATDENEGTVGGTTDAKAAVKDETDVRATGKDETDVKDTDDSDDDLMAEAKAFGIRSGLLRRAKMLAQTCYSVAQKNVTPSRKDGGADESGEDTQKSCGISAYPADQQQYSDSHCPYGCTGIVAYPASIRASS